jgi:molecular chaperone GrpE (heat shock protein)
MTTNDPETGGTSRQPEAPRDGPPARAAGDAATEPEAGSEAAPAAASEPLVERLDRLEQALAGVTQAVSETGSRLGELAAQAEQVAELQRLAAEQVRRLGRRLDEALGAAADARHRDLIGGLMLYYDLVAGVARDGGDASAGMLRSQLERLLAAHGVQPIATDGRADYLYHRAVRRRPVDDPALDGAIVEVWRTGFRLGELVLRPADVVVAAYVTEAGPTAGAMADSLEGPFETGAP